MTFKVDDLVEKYGGSYGGPGIVRGVTVLPGGRLRYLVSHKIEGGTGEFLHVYTEGNLRPREVRNLAEATVKQMMVEDK